MASAHTSAPAHRTRTLWAAGASTFAATVMIVVGLFQFVEGLVTVVNGTKFLVTHELRLHLQCHRVGLVPHDHRSRCSRRRRLHLHRQHLRALGGHRARRRSRRSRTSCGCRTTRSGRSSSSPSTSSSSGPCAPWTSASSEAALGPARASTARAERVGATSRRRRGNRQRLAMTRTKTSAASPTIPVVAAVRASVGAGTPRAGTTAPARTRRLPSR